MPAIDQETGLAIEGIQFPAGHVEISFSEEKERGDGVALIKTILVDPRSCPTEWAALIGAVTDLIDAGLLVLRDPPETIPFRPARRGET